MPSPHLIPKSRPGSSLQRRFTSISHRQRQWRQRAPLRHQTPQSRRLAPRPPVLRHRGWSPLVNALAVWHSSAHLGLKKAQRHNGILSCSAPALPLPRAGATRTPSGPARRQPLTLRLIRAHRGHQPARGHTIERKVSMGTTSVWCSVMAGTKLARHQQRRSWRAGYKVAIATAALIVGTAPAYAGTLPTGHPAANVGPSGRARASAAVPAVVPFARYVAAFNSES